MVAHGQLYIQSQRRRHGLVQLTDGSWNDFDPCFLPNGRIVFVSERRGGFLRCGRYCPTYTMFSMTADGSDVDCVSFHETHEWHPSVTDDSLIVYTRWDYIDRDTNMAHHPWTCRPDGNDPRGFHGNYPNRRESRPWMEMNIRAIPGSHKYVATAAAHHGHAFGSLVIIDPRLADDGAESQLTRLTPEVPFPEAEKHLKPIAECMFYGTAWPLSEEDYLCVYDPGAKNRGLYWIDRLGNKELLYRDPTISCLDPIPLRPRPRPTVIPEASLESVAATGAGATEAGEAPAVIAVMNVYDSDFAWPAGTKVAALRVVQVLPKSTPAPNEPRIGVAEQSSARAVLAPCRSSRTAALTLKRRRESSFTFRRWTNAAWPCNRCARALIVHAGEKLFAWAATNPGTARPVHPQPCPWRCGANLPSFRPKWTAPIRSIT